MNAEKIYDLFVIGGGINGAAIACDASGRGLSVALAEMQDFAEGTSSGSSNSGKQMTDRRGKILFGQT